jgi:hypothetical protein
MRACHLTHRQWTRACSLCYCAGMVCTGLLVGSIGPSIDTLSESVGRGAPDFGLVFIGRGLGYLSGTVLAAKAMSAFSGRGNFISAAVLVGAGLAHGAIPLLHTFDGLITSYVLSGFFLGIADTVHNTLLSWVHGVDTIGSWMQVCVCVRV